MPVPNLEPKHKQAIYREIGERLREMFAREQTPAPESLMKIIHRFDTTEERSRSNMAMRNETNCGPVRSA